MKISTKRSSSFAVMGLMLLAAAVQACSPAPRRQLTAEEKIADLHWLYSQYGMNYAPLEYKEQRNGFDYDGLKAKYLAEAPQTKNNEEFYTLMYRFVAEFSDAHNSGNLMDAGLPGRTEVAYLGFSGKRKGDALVVTSLLPSIADDSNYPVKVGDEITALDGVSLVDIVKNERIQIRDLGQEQANLTYHMNRIFGRVSLHGPLPAAQDAELTVRRGDADEKITLPWVRKDLFDFTKEQAEAKKKKAELEAEEGASESTEAEILPQTIFGLGYDVLNGNLNMLAQVLGRTLRENPEFSFWNTFEVLDVMPTWTSRSLQQALRQANQILTGDPTIGETAKQRLEKERSVPGNVVLHVADSTVYPMYLAMETVKDSEGKATDEKKMVAYLRLDTFSPQTVTSGPNGEMVQVDPVAQLKTSLKLMQTLGVNDLVVDLIDNGGGSLLLGMGLAQALSNEKLVMPGIQFKVSETWLNDFERDSMNAKSDAEREIARRVFRELKADLDAGRTLSRVYNSETLAPYELKKNTDLEGKLNIVLMVNEMCASMCDIFTAILKDNEVAKVVGSQTMGAGGNVVTHIQAPNSNFMVNMTESLIVRNDGSYIENNGVKPDVEVDVNATVMEKYESVRQKALELLVTRKSADGETREAVLR